MDVVHYSRNVLMRLLILALVMVALIVWQRDFLNAIYLQNQITAAGWVINGAIVVLFLTGLARLVQLFYRYMREEEAVNLFVENTDRVVKPTDGVDPDSIIAQRYATMADLYRRRTPINHSALAATLVAGEAAFVSFPKFVNNVLILTGVFGTIVALSIALLGASDMLEAAGAGVAGLGTVIHGLSTALSTTMTAIVCYFFFGYFYLKLLDTQSHVIGRVEQVTAVNLMPRFQVETETVLTDFADLVRAATALAQRIDSSQNALAESAERMQDVLGSFVTEMQALGKGLESIKHLLRDGFRLPGERQ